MSVLLTGGTGFVGLNIAEALVAHGLSVVALDRAPAPPKAIARLGEAFTAVAGDVADADALGQLFQDHDIDLVVQAAAITAGSEREKRDPAEILRVNLGGTLAVLEAARRHDVKRLIYTSSSTVYGENSYADDPLDEATTVPLPESLYGISKYAAERCAVRYRALHGMDIVAVRLSAVFGPWERDTGVRDTLSPMLQATAAARRGEEAVLQREGPRDWVYARDVASAVAILLTTPQPLRHRLYNIGPGTVWSVADWCRKLAGRYPDFRWRVGSRFNIDLHGPCDRNRLAIARLTADTDWHPAFQLDAAFEDYLAWLDDTEDDA